jgi:D-glycero-alpha-D-manno-heptose 1-phosphate guanylyltransferase
VEVIVLAGGFGARLKQVVSDVPKPMAPVAGKPFLEIVLALLGRKGFTRAILSLGYMAEKFVPHFGNRFADMDLAYEIERVPLGTGGAVRQAMGRCKSDHVFVINGDTYLDFEAAEIEAHWQKHHAPIIVAREVADTTRYGRLLVATGQVVKFSEKGDSGPGLINAGCYVLPMGILDAFHAGQAFSLETDFLAKVVSSQRLDLFVTNGQFIDIGVPEDYARAQKELTGTDFGVSS